MKRCPECRRDYSDDTLAFCLEDGIALIQGTVPVPDEPQTAILHETAPPAEAQAFAWLEKDLLSAADCCISSHGGSLLTIYAQIRATPTWSGG